MSFDFITKKLIQQQTQHRYRQRICVAEQNGREVTIAGKTYLNFSSNDYLGLNKHKKINQAMQEGIDRFGLCASASSLVTGFHYAHQSLEEHICLWLNKPRCILYSSGFAANLGVLQALGQENSNFWLDKLSHASLLDGALATKATVKRFLHNDVEQLAQWLNKNHFDKNQTKQNVSDNLIVTEGVFSMDGDRAKVAQLSEIAKENDAWLYVDDAHSIGVIGEKGQGSLSSADPDIVMATAGKAIATSGAFVACNEQLFEYLVNFSRHYIYSTAMSPALAWATKASLVLIEKEQWRRDKIKELSALLASKLNDEIQLIPTESSIHAIIIGEESKTLAVCEKLKNKGIWLTAIRPPTVARNQSRLRVTICASHNNKDISYLAQCLNEVLN